MTFPPPIYLVQSSALWLEMSSHINKPQVAPFPRTPYVTLFTSEDFAFAALLEVVSLGCRFAELLFRRDHGMWTQASKIGHALQDATRVDGLGLQ